MLLDSPSGQSVARLNWVIARGIGNWAGGEQGSLKVEPGEVTQEEQAPEGPPVSSRRFQPADNIAMRITPTPRGLTGSPAPPGPIRFFASFPWVAPTATHGLPLWGNFLPVISCSSETLTEPCGVERRRLTR
jgi:hypothetical protein